MKSSISIQNVYNSYTACFCIECIKASTDKQIPSKLFSSWCWIDGCSSYVFCESNLSQRLYPEVRELLSPESKEQENNRSGSKRIRNDDETGESERLLVLKQS